MKFVYPVLLLFIVSFSFAQETKELEYDYIQKMGKTLDGMEEEDIYMILAEALSKQENSPKKALSKILVTLSKEDQKAILKYANRQRLLQNTAPKITKKEEPKLPSTNIQFDEQIFDFGTVKQGDKVSHIYTFTNTGTNPLVIKNAKGSCGCTVPQWPKDPIAPGQKAEIKIEFNTKGKKGKQNKIVTIQGNFDMRRLTVKGEVLVEE